MLGVITSVVHLQRISHSGIYFRHSLLGHEQFLWQFSWFIMVVRQRVKYVYYTFMVSVVARIVFEPTVGGEFVQPAIIAGQESRRLGASASSAGYYEVVTTN